MSSLKHGFCRGGKNTPEYDAWKAAIQRCTNPRSPVWEHYGGRGIGICDHWRHSFETFLADVGPRPDRMTLERIDNEKGYLCPLCCPPIGNCKWATWSEQGRNRRFSVRRSEYNKAWWAEQSPEYRHERGVKMGSGNLGKQKRRKINVQHQ